MKSIEIALRFLVMLDVMRICGTPRAMILRAIAYAVGLGRPTDASECLSLDGQGAPERLAGAQWSDRLQVHGTAHPATSM